MTPEVVGIRTRETILRLLRERCRISPTVLFIEDLHWIDTASEALLGRAAEGEDMPPLLIVCAYRSHYEPPWAARADVVQLLLAPLSDNGTIELLKRRFKTEDLPAELARLVVKKAEGNPLFVEEICNYLLENGSLRRSESAVEYRSAGEDASLPITLQSLLMERVDRLAEGPRAAIEAAAVIGERFSGELVGATAGINGAAAEHLLALERQELIFQEVNRRGSTEYRFKHALVRDNVYQRLLKPRREKLHDKVGEAIEQIYSDRLGEAADMLAHHFSRTRRADKAVRFLALAGEKSLRAYSLEEADTYFRQAVELMETVPGCADDMLFADVLLAWVEVYQHRQDFKGSIDLLTRYLPRVEAAGDKRRFARLSYWLGFAYTQGAEFDKAKAIHERGLALSEEVQDKQCIAYHSSGLAFVRWLNQRGQPRDVSDRLSNRALECAKDIDDVFLRNVILLGLVFNALAESRFAEARSRSLRLMERGRETGDPQPLAIGFYTLAFVDLFDERYEEALENAEECLRVASRPIDRLVARGAKGAALALMGNVVEGLEILQQARHEAVGSGVSSLLAGIEIPYGVAMVLAGQMSAGVDRIESAIRLFDEWGYDSGIAHAHLVLGEIYLQIALGGEKLPVRLIVKNIGFLVRTLPFAARKAERQLETAIRLTRKHDLPAHLARSLLDMGLLHKAKKRQAKALGCLEEARLIAESVEASGLVERIDVALQSLN